MSDLHVRIAVTADAEAIVRTHHEAVWNTARHHYQPDVLDAWAVTLTDDSYEQVRGSVLWERRLRGRRASDASPSIGP